MAIRTVVTRGYGNGTFNGTIPLVTLRGYASSVPASPAYPPCGGVQHIRNGSFANDYSDGLGFGPTTGWGVNNGWSVTDPDDVVGVSSAARHTPGNTLALTNTLLLDLVEGQAYTVSIHVKDMVAGQFQLNVGGTLGQVITSNGTYTERIVAGGSVSTFQVEPDNDADGVGDNISICFDAKRRAAGRSPSRRRRRVVIEGRVYHVTAEQERALLSQYKADLQASIPRASPKRKKAIRATITTVTERLEAIPVPVEDPRARIRADDEELLEILALLRLH
jgi:hypothetical protein